MKREKLDAFDRLEHFSSPSRWSTPYRRAFVIGIPVFGPLWLVIMTMLVLVALIVGLCLYPIVLLISIWEGKELNW